MRIRSATVQFTAVFLMVSVGVAVAIACQRVGPFHHTELLAATIVVRATALDYVGPRAAGPLHNGIPFTVVRFRVEEVLRGDTTLATVDVRGFLTDADDYNDHAVPYTFVRPGGRSGSCIANSYRKGAQFLLYLKHRDGEWTPYWCGLGPVNEQVHSADDPWVVWSRQYLSANSTRQTGPPN